MQAITTKYFGPRNSQGSKIIAKCDAGSMRMSYRHDLNIDENHKEAARQLITKLGWFPESEPGGDYFFYIPVPGALYGEWYMGSNSNGTYTHVCTVDYARLGPVAR